MDPDHLLGSGGGDAELHDRDRAGVAGEDRPLVGHEPVELAEDVGLHLLVLDDRLDDELAVGHVGQVGGEREPRHGGVALLLGELAGAEAAVERLHEPAAPGLGGRLVDLADEHVEPGSGAHLGDPRAHETASDDADAFDRRTLDHAHDSTRSAASSAT